MSRNSSRPFSAVVTGPSQMRIPSGDGYIDVDAVRLTRESLQRVEPVTALIIKLIMTAS